MTLAVGPVPVFLGGDGCLGLQDTPEGSCWGWTKSLCPC